ncbi:sugar ABC transporter substrate-binding protein [Rhodococcus sp. BP-149]|uniref:ABC transporter substrate-binding protein n=1 Tax=unclassified Rhodococcus (in: high G+C Gram-positive bacteria) TaxID=192944 RepID=UPI001C9AE881|nr:MULTISPECIES: sugar ABC transporter substrate-binding protein [unclassified Rhodococcus (in: high G+C Gram-positive bacteria)]MBY6687296.1 sugar ABC transporter substrate-binding protein [Rhodococcus sp. BP-288]MBY6694281.1 sugar ABC transporter substrate-binding protein [Rhodococcus sp. BP-188]MBY6697990.1 sugar ABC transporter substrate-binding protein [Rhodococcus sp. BP-285]MBY6704210.1 sugar ABC transporter substrate-binding protein [Rhodococcus sp. BP-283]MBY6712859.1 sugar ABC transp
MTWTPRRRTTRAAAALAVVTMTVALSACGSSSTVVRGDPSNVEGVDDGTTLTLWTRAPLEAQANLLVDAYNSSHQNQVELTVVPNDDYVAKVGAAAGSGDLPDLFAADAVYLPNWTSAGLFGDLTERIGNLDYRDEINPSIVEAGTFEDQEYVLPFVLDLSVMFYNKALYREAGLDPEKGPTTMTEFRDQALAVESLNKPDTHGTYFGGNCGGCSIFTWFPMMWASGEDVLEDDGTTANLAGETAQDIYGVWRDLEDAGAIAPGAADETGATWTAAFQQGQIGVMPYPATLLQKASETVDVGVSAIPGVDGGTSTFVGGDGLGISKDSDTPDQAWNFMQWLMSEDAQVGVLAANNVTPARADFLDNEFTADPRVQLINSVSTAPDSRTPKALNFQQAFNAVGSPWSTLVRNQVFGDPSTLQQDNDAITDLLQK